MAATKLRQRIHSHEGWPGFTRTRAAPLPPLAARERRAARARLSLDVIINNHNYAAYVGRAIESALDQGVDVPTAVIVVDDGSTDDSRPAIEAYGSRIVSVFQAHGGQASAFNAGISRSSADVVIFLDADDALAPGGGRRAVSAFEEDPSLARVQFRMEVMDERGRPTGVIEPPPHLPMARGDVRPEELAFPFDLTWMATSGNAFAAWALGRICPVPEDEFRLGADWYVVHLVSLLGRVASLDEVGSYRRVHGENRYQLSHGSLDLGHVRKTVAYAASARKHLERLAYELELAETVRSLSVSDLANRLVSLRLDPAAHPLRSDTVRSLLFDAVRASLRRFDVRWPMRALFILWFLAATLAPRRLVPPLAEVFLFPERRRRLNRMLGALHGRR